MLAALFALLFAAPSAAPLPCNAPGVTPPVLTHRMNFDLGELRRAPMIVLALTVNSRGKVESVTVVRGAGPDLDKKFVRAVSAWKFRPARRKGKPVTCMMNVQVHIEVR